MVWGHSRYFQKFSPPPLKKNPLFVVNNSSQVLVTGDGTKHYLEFPDKIYDAANQWSTQENKFNAADTGEYHVQISIFVSYGTQTATLIDFYIETPQYERYVLNSYIPSAADLPVSMRALTGAAIIHLEKDDVARFCIMIDGNDSKCSSILASYPGYTWTRLNISRIA